MSEIEAAGDIATGAVVARAFEPGHGEAGGETHARCLNCATPLVGAHCHACGQAAHVHRTLGAIGHEIAHGVFHFEGKIWRTLPLLLWRPGELTRRYVHGERARFVSPLALFLFCVFATFAVYSSIGGSTTGTADLPKAARLAEARAAVVTLEKRRAQTVQARQPTNELDKELRSARVRLAGMETGTVLRVSTTGAGVDGPLSLDAVKLELRSPALDARARAALKNPGLLFYRLQSTAYKYAWALIPMSLPFMWLLFVRRRREYKMYDHAIFVTYSISFVMLLLIAMRLLSATGIVTDLPYALIPVHFYLQLKDAYRLSRLGALWRAVVLVLIAGGVLVAFVLVLVLLGLLA